MDHSPPSASEPRDHQSCRLAARPWHVYRRCCHVLGESTPLLQESIEPWEADACLDVNGAHKTAVLLGGTKALQSSPGRACVYARWWLPCGCSSHRFRHCARLVRTMLFWHRESQCQQPRVFPLNRIPSHFRYCRKLVCMDERDYAWSQEEQTP